MLRTITAAVALVGLLSQPAPASSTAAVEDCLGPDGLSGPCWALVTEDQVPQLPPIDSLGS